MPFARLLIAIACVAALPAVARAQARDPDQARAKVLYDDGRRHYDAGAYGQAIAAWKEGYALASAPMFLFNIAQAYRFAGDCTRARAYYARYRQAAPTPPNAAELDAAETLCRDVVPPAPPPAAEPAALAGKDSPTSLTSLTAPTAPRGRGSRARRVATISLGTAGLLTTGVGVAFAARSRSRWNHIESLCGSDFHCDDDASLAQARALEVDARGNGERATIAVTAGVAALTTAIVLHLTRPRDDDGRDVAITTSFDGEHASVLATGSF